MNRALPQTTSIPPPPRSPAAVACFALCGGVLLGASLPGSGTLPLLLALLLLSLCGLPLLKPARSWLLLLALVSLGAAEIQTHLRRASPTDISLIARENPLPAQLTLANASAVRPVANTRQGLTGFTAEADALSFQTETGETPASGRIRIWLRSDSPPPHSSPSSDNPFPHGRFQAFGMLRRPLPASNPGEMDFAQLDRLSRIGAELSLSSSDALLPLDDSASPIDRILNTWRQFVRNRLSSGLDPGSTPQLLLQSLLLGDVDGRLRDIRDDFQRSGTTHHLAVSGTHIAVVGGFAYLLLRTLGVAWTWLTPRRTLLATLVVIALYGAAVTPGPPVTRSVLLAGVVGLGLLSGRHIRMANLLGVCGILMVLLDPGQVLTPGFQLTFFVVWGLIVLGPGLYHHLLEYRDRDFLIADQWMPQTPGARRRRWKWKLTAGLAVGLVAWACASPIVAHHFSQANPYAWLTSILLAPVVYTTIVTASLKVVASGLCPWGSELWAYPARWTAELLRLSVHWAALAPGGEVRSPPFPGWIAVLALASLAATQLPTWNSRRVRSVVWLTAFLLSTLGPMLTGLLVSRGPGVRITLLSVGAGQCVVVESPQGHITLLDAGGDGEVYRRVLDPYLRSRAIGQIHTAILTHSDADHIGAIPDLLLHRRVGEIRSNADMLQRDGIAARIRYLAQHRGTPVQCVGTGDSWQHEGLTFDVLHPTQGESWGDNDSSLVIRLTYAGKVILFTGDIEAPAQTSLLQRPYELRADLLVAPHHGSFESTTPDFIRATEASTLLVSADRTPSGKQRLFSRTFSNYPIFSTARQGAITLHIHPDGTLTTECFRP